MNPPKHIVSAVAIVMNEKLDIILDVRQVENC